MRHVVFVLLFSVSLSSAHEPEIHTSRKGARVLPLPKAKDVFHFVIFGDRTGGPAEGIKVLQQAVKDTNLLDPDLVMTVGDLVQGYNTQKPWIKQMKEFKGVMSKLKMPWFPVAGNHDVYWRGPKKPVGEHEKNYEMHFGPLWYWFKHKNVGFVVLYTDEGDLKTGEKGYGKPSLVQMSKKQMEWLSKSLSQLKGMDHVFVFLHHPRWVEQWYKGSNWNDVHKILAKAGNVKAVFAGHIHRMRYDGKKDGIEYFSLATTGGGLPGKYPKVGYLHHMNIVTVRKDKFTVAAIPVGVVIDPRQFTALRQKDIDLLRNLTPKRESKPLGIGARGDVASYYQFTLTNPASRAIEVTITPESTGKGWVFIPDHQHVKLAAGEKKTMEVALAHKGAINGLKVPKLDLTIDYLEKGSRIRVPPRKVNVDVALREIPEESHHVKKNGLLSLSGKNYALRLNGLRLPQGAMTVEAWVKPTQHTESQALVGKTQMSGLGLFLNKGKPRFEIFLGDRYSSVIAKDAITLNQWSHVAAVYDEKEVRLYVNGKQVDATKAGGAYKQNSLPLYVGAEPASNGSPARFFKGGLDEIRICKGARYLKDGFTPAKRFEPDASTLLLLHCDKHLGPFAVDHSPTRSHPWRVGATKILVN